MFNNPNVSKELQEQVDGEFILGVKVGAELAIKYFDNYLYGMNLNAPLGITDKQIIGDMSFGDLRKIADDKGWSYALYNNRKKQVKINMPKTIKDLRETIEWLETCCYEYDADHGEVKEYIKTMNEAIDELQEFREWKSKFLDSI